MRLSRTVSLSVILAAAWVVSACGGGPAAPSASSDPALAALRACIDSAPDGLCPRPTVQTDSGAVVADQDYWTALRDRDRGGFEAAVVACGRAGASGAAVGSVAGARAAERRFAREKLAGRLTEDARFDDGVCLDVYAAFTLDLLESGRVGTANGDLTGAEAAFVAAQSREARDRAALDAMGGQAYDGTSVGSQSGQPSAAPRPAP